MAKVTDIALVGGIALVAFLVLKAGKDLFNALPDLDAGIRQSIGDIQDSLGGFAAEQQSNIDNFISEQQSNFDNFFNTDFFKQDDSSSIAGETIIQDDSSTIFIPESTVVDPITGIVTSDTPPLLDLSDQARQDAIDALEINRQRSILENELDKIPVDEDISGAEFASAINDAEFRARQEVETQQEEILRSASIVSEPIVSELPTENLFGSGGPSFIGGTIRENPIDTLGEVIDLFPQLSASEAADFLDSFSGISPSDALRIDPDVKNITANIDDVNIPIENASISSLDEQEKISACLTCDSFGLNCDICNEGLA